MTGESIQRETRKAASYRFLSNCYYPPDDDLVAALCGSDAPVNALFSEPAWNASELDPLEALQVEHARLFLGPYKVMAPPQGSAYLEDTGQIMGESTMDVLAWYREEGLDVVLKEPPDHIISELEFMHLLACRCATALSEGDSEQAAHYQDKQVSFLARHLGRWAPDFARRVQDHADTKFYAALGFATESFIQENAQLK